MRASVVAGIALLSARRCYGALTVTLVRHGETEWNKAGKLQGAEDSPLTDDGLRGAIACGQRLAGTRFTVSNIAS